MKLSYKIAISLGALSVAVIATAASHLHTTLVSRFDRIEAVQASREVARLNQLIRSEVAHLSRFSEDYACWDDTWNFVQGKNSNYINESVASETFVNARISHISLRDSTGKVVWARSYAWREGVDLPTSSLIDGWSVSLPLLLPEGRTCSPNCNAEGVLPGSLGPLLVTQRAVLPNSCTGTPSGTLTMARLLDSVAIRELRAQSVLDFAISSEAGEQVSPQFLSPLPPARDGSDAAGILIETPDLLTVGTHLEAANGQSSFLLSLQLDREVQHQGLATVRQLLLYSAILVVITFLALLLLLDRLVISPISLLASEMMRAEEMSGSVLSVDISQDDEVGDLARNFEQLLARIQERTFALEDANRVLERIAARDGLTGQLNRRSFDTDLSEEWRRHARHRHPLSLLLIDIDNFKAFNDAAGHLAGDDCLQRIADLLCGSLQRAGDRLYRYGGEEFAVLLPHTPLLGALHLAETLRNHIEEAGVLHPGLPHTGNGSAVVTISLGVASALPSMRGDPTQLISMSDVCLYRAKVLGRNRIEGLPMETFASDVPLSRT
jgi:diguanylate cyclase (GGDEF)-like protein